MSTIGLGGFVVLSLNFTFVRIKMDCKEGWWGIICPKSLFNCCRSCWGCDQEKQFCCSTDGKDGSW